MADTKTIEVPVKLKAEFRDINKGLQKVLRDIQDGLTEVDPASGLAKNLTKAYAEFEKQLSKSQGLLNKEFFSEADMSKVTKAWDKISEILSTIDSQVSHASLGTLGIDIDGLTEAKQKFDDITKARQAFLTQPVKADITAGALSLAQKHSDKTGFKETANYGRNLANMTTASATLAEQLKVLERQAFDTQEALDKATLSHTTAQANLNIAEGNKRRQEGLYNTQYGNVVSAFTQAGAAANVNSPQSIINAYKNTIASLVSNGAGEFAENGQLIARMIRDWFDLDIDFSKEANEIVEDLQNGLENALKKNSNNWGKRGKLNGKALQNVFTPFSQKAGKDNFSASKTSKELTAAVAEAQEEVNKTKAAIDDTSEGSLNSVKIALDTQIAEAKNVISEINAAIEELKNLRTRRGEQAEAIFGEQQREARQGVLDLENQARLNTQYRKNVGEGQRLTHQGAVEADAVVTDRKAAERARKEQEERIRRENEQQSAAEKAAKDSEEQFRQRLTQSIHQWTSVQQIVNKIKDGFRQAIQDIKGLDQAMTNIAVVTDMSVSDLWGKIDEYMSIAQQYGVTTQGVYEVSQLYYQQGLGTDEVMAATTETLKMARIAGMEYAEAADAMTVAIRAFKMEMSDAEHVTDVYSKVAAVTASDTEELAVAMSKTASSAESVGSSFENTTAMLAVMIETTRESAQNLGSALKSIISRYGEMKVGLTVDSEGETIDYNKVDTALKSVGISIKDAQGQFRDFDDVIFELSEKWDSLDKNTQRYIATIMAGNRQQSRFIALVDNWERLDEVAGAAQDSEDAGLLQYAKTLDSLESKVNNIKTSFQQFYMSVFNGPVVGAGLEFLNNLIKGFNKLSKLTTIFNAVSIISGIRIIGELIVNTFSGAFKNISTAWKTTLKEMRLGAAKEARATGRDWQNGFENGKREADDPDIGNDAVATKTGRKNALISAVLSAAGMGLSAWGSSAAASNQTTGALLSGAGNGLSAASLVMSLGAAIPGIGWAAAAVGGITAVVSAITSMPSALEKAQEDLAKAEEKAEKSNIERATKKNEYETLKREISNLEKLEKARFDSAEAQQEWISANNALFEQFPYLAATFDEVGNATIDLESAEQALAIARKASLSATIKAAEDEKDRVQNDLNVAKEKQKENYDKIATGQKFKLESGKTYKAPALISGTGAYSANFYQWLLSPKRAEQAELLKQTGVLSEQVAKSGQVSYELTNDSSVFSTFLFNFLDQLNAEQHSEWLATFEGLTQEETVSKLISEGASKFTNSEGKQIYKTTQDFLAAWLHRGAAFTSLNEQQQEYIEYIIATINSSTQEIEGLENQITGADKTLLASKTAEQLQLKEERDEKDYDETYGKIAGWDGYVARYVKEAQAAVEEPFDDKRIGEEVEFAVAQWDDLEDELNQPNKLEDYNSLVESFEKGNISLKSYYEQLGDLFEQQIPVAVQQAYDWAESETNTAIETLTKGLLGKEGAWIKDENATKTWLKSIPENLQQNVIDYVNYIKELLTSQKINPDLAESMISAYTGLYDSINNNINLTAEQKASAFTLLDSADLTSLGGIYEYQDALREAGIDLGSTAWSDIIANVLVNIVTETQTFQQKLAKMLDADVKLLKEAYEGVDSAAEATELASKLGVTLADFESSDGKMRLKRDIELSKKLTDERKAELQTYKENLYGAEENWKEGDSAYAKEYQEALLSGNNQDSEIYKKYQAEFEKWIPADRVDKTLANYIIARRDSELEAIDGLFADFWEQQEKLIKKQGIIDDFYNTNGKENGEANRKKLSAQQSLASGGQGLSGETIYDILDAYGLNPEDWQTYFTKNADGTFDIIKYTELFNKLDQATKNAIIASIEKKAQAAEEGLTKLAESAAKKETLTPSEIRATLGESAAGFSDEMANAYYRLFTDAVADGTLEDNDALRKDVRTHFENLGYKDSELDNAVNGFFAIFGDAITDTSAKILELKGKALRGELTETEWQTLTEKGIDPQVIKDLENRTQEAISNYVNEIISNTELDFDAKVSTLKKDVFTPKLKEKFGEDIRGLAETAVKGSFNTQEAAADFLSQFYVAMGGAISDTKLDDWIEEGTTGYTLDYEAMSEAIEARKAEINNQSNLTASNYEVQKALNDEWNRLNSFQDDLNYYSSIQAQQRKESLYPALQSMAADKNITASQLMDLFKNQNKEITLEEAQTYQQELETLSPLARLKKLREYLEKKEVTIDESEYKEIVKETYASVMSSVSGAIGKLGSGISWDDTFGLIEEVEGLDFEDFDLINGQYFIKNISKVTDHYLNQLKEIYGNEIPANVQEEAQAAIEQLKKQAEKDLEIAKYAAQWGEALEEGGIEQTKTEGLDLLKSKGYKGYTAQDMATLQAAGLIKTDAASLEKIQSQIDEETGAFYLTPEDLQPVTAATRNALKLTLDQEVQSAKTAAENLATKMASGTAEFGDYEALFKESITPENFDIVEPLLNQYIEDQSNAADVKNALKRAYPDMEEENIDAILANWVAFYADAKHDTARSIFDTKIDALNNRYLSEAAKKTLIDNDAEDFVEKLTDLAKKSANDIFNLVYEEYNKALDAGTINREEYRSGLAEQASKAFTAKAEEKYADLYVNQATEEIASGDALYDTDALGALYASIADKEKQANKNAEYKFEDFYNDFVTGITESGEAILDVKKLKAQNYISDRRYKEYSSALVDNLFSSAENIITQFKTGDTTGLDLQIQQMFDSLGMVLSDKDTAAIVEGGEQVLLNRLIFEIGRAGLDTTEVQSRLEELQALILDTIVESISSGMSALGEGIEGTLSEASFLDLQKRYGFKDSSFRTSRGVQLSAQNLQDVITGLYGDAKTNGRTADFGKQLLEVLNTEGSGFEGYKDIEEAIADANKQIAEGVDGAKEYAEALELARNAAYEMADAAEFAFMEQDPYNGKADTFDKFTENVKKAKEALATFGKGGKVAHTDLSMMFNTIKSSDSATKNFEAAMSTAGKNIDEILNSMLHLNDLGEIDIGEWAAQVGIDVETATTAMSEGMSEALIATAKDQIKYLSGLEAMLEAMVALEGIGSIKLDLEFNTGLTDNEGNPIIVKQLSEVYDWWDKLSKDQQLDLQANITTTLKNASGKAELQSFMKGFGFDSADFFTTFFGAKVDSAEEVQLADAFGSLIEQIPNMTEGQVETVVEEMNRVLQDSMLRDQDGKFVGLKEGYINSLLQLFSTFNLSDIPESLNIKIREALATNNNKITIPIKDGIDIAITSSADGKGLNIVDANGNALTGLSEEQISAVKETLASQLGMAVENIKVDAKTGLVNFYGEAAQIEAEALKTEFASISEAATGVSDAITALKNLLADFQVSDAFREFVGLMTQLITGSTGVTKTVEGAQNAANMEDVAGEGDGENERTITLNIDIQPAQEAITAIEDAYNNLAELLSTPITIGTNAVRATTDAALSGQGGNVPPAMNPDGSTISPLTTHTVQIVWDIPQPDFDSIKEPTIGFDWKQPTTAPGPRRLPTINFRWGSAVNDPEYTGSAIKIPIEYVESITEDAEVVAWTGTMNDISGAAFADGSIGRLYSGAQLAGKTLVGELGPELAVYDGQYHLLGQHGAEFVNLPSDAIVFNHRQTEGIARGQFNIRGKAMAEGNITGPAMAGGAAEALAAVRRAKSLWQGLLDSLSAAELTSMGGGGGGGNNLEAIHEDLQEWYNLSRKIANIEQEINNIIAERQNIAAGDGGAYLRSLREEQALLQQQIANQEILQQYQEEQLKRQAEHINNNKIWSQFLQIGPDGLLQYTNGNERFGGKGALEVLAQLNEMSAQEQINFITDLGYSYTDQNGKQLTGSDLVAKFFEELQLQIDQYDALYDAVHESSEALANLQNNINKINEEIRQNKIDLENSIYDVLVEAWEAEIEALEEQKELIEEANEAYIDGLNDALQAERDMYDQQQSVADRESLQRQLALLRRSGGSASEIADLERQLDDMLKQEYFDSQQKTIENIQDANEKQIKQLERQIQLQEEALTYQKENGVLWAKVAEIMDGSPESILAILQGNSSAFFAASTEQQAKMLEEWAMKVGIYTEDRIYQQHASFAKEKIWDSGDVWNEEGMGEFKDYYAGLDEKDRNTIRDVYAHAYANALLKGEKPEDARKAAAKAASDALKKKQEADKDKKNDDTDDTGDTSNPGGSTPTYSKIKIEISCSPPEGGTASASPNPCEPNTTVTVTPKANSGYKFTHITVGGQSKTGLSFMVTGNVSPVSVVAYFEPVDTSTSEEEATAAAKIKVKQDPEATYIAKKYSKGGLVDYTGLAMVHGSPSKPEGFLNAEQTEIISQALTTVGDGGALDGIKRTLAALNANVQSIVNHVSNEVSSFTVAPGAVTIQVEELKDSYDIEKLSNDIMNRMVTIASKSTNRGINRR